MSVGERDYRLTCLTYGSQPAAHVTWWVDGVQMPHQSYVTEVTLRSCFRAALLFQKKRSRRDTPLTLSQMRQTFMMRCISFLQVGQGGEGNVTNSTLTFRPQMVNDGKRITCKAENQLVRNSAISDNVVLNVLCELKRIEILLKTFILLEYLSYKYFKRCI